MFNATEIRRRSGKQGRIHSYFKSQNFQFILAALVSEGVPTEQIIRTTRGKYGETLLHDYFLLDYLSWIGGAVYFRALKKYTPTTNHKDSHAPQ